MNELQKVINELRSLILKRCSNMLVKNQHADEIISLLQKVGEVSYVKSSFGTHLNFKLHLHEEVARIIDCRAFKHWQCEFIVPDYAVKKDLWANTMALLGLKYKVVNLQRGITVIVDLRDEPVTLSADKDFYQISVVLDVADENGLKEAERKLRAEIKDLEELEIISVDISAEVFLVEIQLVIKAKLDIGTITQIYTYFKENFKAVNLNLSQAIEVE